MSNIGANRNVRADKDEEEELPVVGSSLLLTEDMWRQKVCVNLIHCMSMAH